LLLAEGPLLNPVILLFTDGEEVGLLGAEAFVTHPWFADVGVVVNLEARGSSGQSMLFETSENNAWLIEAFAERAPRPVANSLLYELYRLLPNDTDFSVYKEAGLAGINFAYSDEVAHYHTPLDDLEHLDRASLQHHGDNVLAAARAFGSIDLSDPAAGSSIYLDLVPGSVLRLPVGWAVPLAVVCMLLWVVMIVVLSRRRLLDWPGVGLGVLATVLGLAFAGALGTAVVEVIAAITGRGSFFYADPLPTRAAIWLAAFLGTLLAAAPLARRAGFWGMSAGVWLLWGLASVVAAVALPGASVFFLVPLLASAAAYGLAVLTPQLHSVWAGPLAATLTAFVTAYLWLPFVLGIESGLGLEFTAAIAVCAALAFTALTPLVAPPVGHGQGRAVLMLAALAGVIVTGAMAVDAENFSAFRPQRLSLLHLQRAEEGQPSQAWWLIDAFPAPPLTEELSEVATFVHEDSIRLPWTSASFLSADAPPLDATPPSITVVSDESTANVRIVTLQLNSPRGAPRIVLMVPAGSDLESIAVPGTSYVMPVEDAEETGRPTTFTCHGTDCDGTTIELHIGNSAPLAVMVGDLSYGLPPAGAALQEARPESAVPSQDGDVSVVMNSVTIPSP
ncbi:MAG TPA: M28 family peptidase, partial [Trueperaceae bacterium]|nr:M28 family peptidase [Trueperaceae bacterium]